jgi:hypothetical protein
MNDIDLLISDFKELKEVEAFAIGGSRATGKSDEKSDYDVYIYINQPIDEKIRTQILEKHCSYIEISNHYWELEDNCTLKSGIDIDIIYRDLEQFKGEIKSVVDDYNSHNGYTTCMWHNLVTAQIIFDKTGELTTLKKSYQRPYPQELKKHIISQNMNLLSGVLPSYDLQIKKAVERKDFVSINHRVTEFLASYFDIIFALNEMTHPGEKREMSICNEQCKTLPTNFEKNLIRLFSYMFDGEVLNEIIKDMVIELKKLA